MCCNLYGLLAARTNFSVSAFTVFKAFSNIDLSCGSIPLTFNFLRPSLKICPKFCIVVSLKLDPENWALFILSPLDITKAFSKFDIPDTPSPTNAVTYFFLTVSYTLVIWLSIAPIEPWKFSGALNSTSFILLIGLFLTCNNNNSLLIGALIFLAAAKRPPTKFPWGSTFAMLVSNNSSIWIEEDLPSLYLVFVFDLKNFNQSSANISSAGDVLIASYNAEPNIGLDSKGLSFNNGSICGCFCLTI